MSWKDTTREFIKLTSPNGAVFQALWKNNDRNFERKLGIFDMPRFKGTIVQDLGVKSVRYPLTIIFDGEDNQEDAESFFTTLYDEGGQWEVVHPTKGTLALQLVSCSEAISGVEPNTTEITTNWINPANVNILLSKEELSTSVFDSILNVKDDALTSLQKLRTDSYAAMQSSINTFNKVAGSGNKFFNELSKTSSVIQDEFDSAISAFNSAAASYGIGNTDSEPMANATIDIISVPAGANTDYSSRFYVYNTFIDSNILLTPTTTTENDINILLSIEFSVIVSLSIISDIAVTSIYKSRSDVVSAIQSITELFNNTIILLDTAQTNFAGLDLDKQFFSNIDTYSNLMLLFSQTIRFLMTQFYSLSAEKRITIKNPRSPIEVTVTEYGELGDDDFYYDLFLDSNNLQENEILLLPIGKEVVIYV